MIDDDKWGIIKKSGMALGRSMYNTRQIGGASTFNNGFDSTYAGPDGKELFATDHPLIGGGTEQNELTAAADLGVTSLRQAFNDMADTVDERGLDIQLTPKHLMVPDELLWDAEELLKSAQRPGTSNNEINAFQVKSVDYFVWHFLTDPDAWFLVSDKMDHNLKFYDREPVNVSSDYDFDADAAKTKIRARWSYGWSDWRGVFGSPGA
jgi:phage major head subunit gpT-like protein